MRRLQSAQGALYEAGSSWLPSLYELYSTRRSLSLWCQKKAAEAASARVICYFGSLILCITNGITADKQPSTGFSPRE